MRLLISPLMLMLAASVVLMWLILWLCGSVSWVIGDGLDWICEHCEDFE